MKISHVMKIRYSLLIFVISIVVNFQNQAQAQNNNNVNNKAPNIIIFNADDISWNDFGCYGNKFVYTPNIDKLAGDDLRFNNAILTASSCSPNRISIMTGRYPQNTEAGELHTEPR
jgi:N-sulfoglucosamine sulfohydrolase